VWVQFAVITNLWNFEIHTCW